MNTGTTKPQKHPPNKREILGNIKRLRGLADALEFIIKRRSK